MAFTFHAFFELFWLYLVLFGLVQWTRPQGWMVYVRLFRSVRTPPIRRISHRKARARLKCAIRLERRLSRMKSRTFAGGLTALTIVEQIAFPTISPVAPSLVLGRNARKRGRLTTLTFLDIFMLALIGIITYRFPPNIKDRDSQEPSQTREHSPGSGGATKIPSDLICRLKPVLQQLFGQKYEGDTFWDADETNDDDLNEFFDCDAGPPPPNLAAYHSKRNKKLGTQAFDTDSFPLFVDACASACISNDKDDFVGDLQPINIDVNGVGGSATTTHKGTLRWVIEDDNGLATELLIPDSYLAPNVDIKVFSPHHIAQKIGNKMSYRSGDWEGYLTWQSSDSAEHSRVIPYDIRLNIPIMNSAASYKEVRTYLATSYSSTFGVYTNVVSDDEGETEDSSVNQVSSFTDNHGDPTFDNDSPLRNEPVKFDPSGKSESTNSVPNLVDDPSLPEDQRLLLWWHYRLGHVSSKILNGLAKIGILPSKLRHCRLPLCPECQYGKAHRRPWRQKTQKTNIKVATKPGQVVSIDQLESGTPGFIAQSKGSLTKGRYRVATVFVDHYSGLDYVHLQRSTSAEETLEAKAAFERFAATHGVRILHYHADNGIFADNAFREACRRAQQGLTFCGVGAHHQNGVAERRIRDLSEHARAMLFHAAFRWPKAVTVHLWPYALRLASEIRRNLPREPRHASASAAQRDKAPIQLFSQTSEPVRIKHFHPFGCPVYVLDDDLQTAGRKKPRWSERSRIGIYLGLSPEHAASVGLVLNPITGLVSPQFHLIFDDHFDVVNKDERFRQSFWQSKSELIASPTHDLPPLASDHILQEIPDPLKHPWDLPETLRNEGEFNIEPSAAQQGTSYTTDPASDGDHVQTTTDPASDGDHVQRGRQGTAASASDNIVQLPPRVDTQLRRSQRTVTLTDKARQSYTFPSLRTYVASLRGYASTLPDEFKSHFEDFFNHEERVNDLFDDTQNQDLPIAFAAKSDPDTFGLSQARREPDWSQFSAAMIKEVEDHEKRGHWIVVPLDSVPKDLRIIDAVWSFKRKRLPTGQILKYKARLCAHGGQQTFGVNYWDTYSPVVTWYSIRTMLIIALINGWHTRQIDFILAFPQATLTVDIYMRVPWGFTVTTPEGKPAVLKLVKNLYGLCDAGKTWYEYLRKGLMDRGCVPSKVDPCVFYKGSLVMCIYVDDVTLFCPEKAPVDKLIQSLSKSFTLEDEGNVTNYLGVHVQHHNDGSIELSQPHLIQRIIDTLGLKNDSKLHGTPAISVLNKDKDGEPFSATWSYRSVVGMMSYLANTTRPDISMPVHQCARFGNDPRKSHQDALKRIGRYLKATKDKGIVLTPGEPTFEVFVDADYAGGYSKETNADPSSVISRTGYVITYAKCPIAWVSKMQTEVCLSTVESEYVALSTSLRDVIPLMELLQEAKTHGGTIPTTTPTVKCTLFEDNTGALELATMPKMRPRTKHIACKYHHFREHVRNGTIKIKYVKSENQLADILTKPLREHAFVRLRKRLCGW